MAFSKDYQLYSAYSRYRGRWRGLICCSTINRTRCQKRDTQILIMIMITRTVGHWRPENGMREQRRNDVSSFLLKKKWYKKLWSLHTPSSSEEQLANCEAFDNRWLRHFQCSGPAVIADLWYGPGQFLKTSNPAPAGRHPRAGFRLVFLPVLIGLILRRGLFIATALRSSSLSSLQVSVVVFWGSAPSMSYCCRSHHQDIIKPLLWMIATVHLCPTTLDESQRWW